MVLDEARDWSLREMIECNGNIQILLLVSHPVRTMRESEFFTFIPTRYTKTFWLESHEIDEDVLS